jgi:hypothetical protein
LSLLPPAAHTFLEATVGKENPTLKGSRGVLHGSVLIVLAIVVLWL